MPRKAKISFDMEDIADISSELIEVNNNVYTRKTSNRLGSSLRFPIPTPIKIELELKAGDICFFCQYSEGFYISFKHKPKAATKAQIRSRKLAVAGKYDTLYVCIPPFIKNLYKETIQAIQLVKPKGFQNYEWQILFLFTDFT